MLMLLTWLPRLARFLPILLAVVAVGGGILFKRTHSQPETFKSQPDITAPTRFRLLRNSDDADAQLRVRFNVPKEEDAPDHVDVPLVVRDGRLFLDGESPTLKDGSPLVDLQGSHNWYLIDPQFDRLDLGIGMAYRRSAHGDDDPETYPFEPAVRVGLVRFAGGAAAVDALATFDSAGLGISLGSPNRLPYPLNLLRVGAYRVADYDDGRLDTVVALSIGTR